MKKLELRILLTLAALVTLAGGMALTPTAHANTLLWSDEFNGTSIDTNTWIIYNQADGSASWYSPTNMSEGNGELDIANVQQTSGSRAWGGGGMESRTELPQYCYLEARVKFSVANSYDWGTWWTVGWTNNALVWPPEMDICEYQGQTNANPGQTYWWNWGGSGNTDAGRSTGIDESQWHTYGVYWNPSNAPVFYVDGIMTEAPVGPDEADQEPAKLKFTSSPNSNTRYSGCLLSTMEADYVRVYDSPPAQPAPTNHLALNQPATASSYKNTGGVPQRAVDSSQTVTRWESNWSDPQWIRVDLNAICSVNQVTLNWQNAAGQNYLIQVATNSWGPWTTCTSITGNATTGWITHTFAAQTGRYIRLYGTARTTAYGYSLYDMQVYGTVVNSNPGPPPARPDMALNKTAVASSLESGGLYPANLAVDGNDTTRWSSAFSDPQWIYVDLGATNPVDTVSIFWESAAAKAYTVQLANNTNGPWTVVYTTTNSTAGVKNIEFPSQSARYVEVNGTARTTTYGYSIFTLNVYGGAATNSGGGNPPPVPTGLAATAVSSSQINLSWNSSSGATSYNVKRSTTSGGPYTTIATGVTPTSYSDTGLSAGTTYYYVVSAVNGNGESANSTQASAITVPSAPTGLTASTVSSSQINLSWNASSGAASYNVKSATVNGGPYTTIASGVTPTSYSNTGLTPNTTYYYVVSAVNSSGESANSSQTNATTSSGGGGTVLLSQGQPVTASSFQGGNAPTNGNDGNFSTRWAASSGTFPQWWRVDLGSIHTLQSVSNYWYNASSRNYQYQIQVSNDDTNYTTVVNKTNNVTDGNTSDTFSATNRYVRIYVTHASAGYASFYESQVFGQ